MMQIIFLLLLHYFKQLDVKMRQQLHLPVELSINEKKIYGSFLKKRMFEFSVGVFHVF